MIGAQKKDVHYSFVGNLRSPILGEIIDDHWRSDRLVDLDLVFPTKTVQNKLHSADTDDAEMQAKIPILE